MVQNPTVLILGAGASMPYGFPSGANLVKWMAYPDRIELSKNIHTDFTKFIYLVHTGASSFQTGEQYNYYNAHNSYRTLQLKLGDLSSAISLDFFLRNNPEYLEVGKMAIAFIMYYLESKEKILYPIDLKLDWYSHLWKQIKAETFNDFISQPLRIYTFNYDLSLDYFLYKQIQYQYNEFDSSGRTLNAVNIEDAKDLMPKHIYGSRYLNLSQDTVFNNFENIGPYYKDEYNQVIFAKNSLTEIHLINEKKTEDVFKELNSTVEQYRKAQFMGFGFDDANLKNLDIKFWLRNNYIIKGTIKGYSKAEKRDLLKNFYDDPSKMNDDVELILNPLFVDKDCHGFIRDEGYLL